MPQTPEDSLKQFLRGQTNPFEEFVAADDPCAQILRSHVSEIHSHQRDLLITAIDRYRLSKKPDELQLYPSRMVRIQSPRGGGKTHLRNWIKCRTEARELFVCPRFFEGETHFNEYLLQQLIGTLLNVDDDEDDANGSSPNTLRSIANDLTRQMLREAVRSLNIHQWLCSTEVVHDFGVILGWKWNRARNRQQQLIDRLAENPDQSIRQIYQSCGLRRRTVLKLLDAFISRRESGNTIISQMRRGFLHAISHLGVAHDREPIQRFLETDFANIPAAIMATRSQLVENLLRTTVEMLAVSGYPAIFMFDNIERLFRPHGQFDQPLAQDFFTNLAHVTDDIPGMLFLYFVEEGAWQDCLNSIDQFADHRVLQRGVRLSSGEDLREVILPNPQGHEIKAFVEQRMRPLLEQGKSECQALLNEIQLSPIFPFPENEDFSRLGVLRETILYLRDRYAEILGWEINNSGNGVKRVKRTQPEVEAEVLEPLWQQQIDSGMNQLRGGQRGNQASVFQVGLGEWLRLVLLNQQIQEWHMTEVLANISFGTHPTYGRVSVVVWRRAEKEISRRVAIGVMLGGSSGKPTDMRTKLCMFNEREAIAEELVLLWPYDDGPPFSANDLPTGTRTAWDDLSPGHRVVLRGITNQEVAMLLGFSEWLATVNQRQNEDHERDVEWPPNAVGEFASRVTRGLSDLILPVG